MRFSSLQYLSIKKPTVKSIDANLDELTITLNNYVLLSPDALPLDETNKEEKLQAVIEKTLALIEYRSVDPDYDGGHSGANGRIIAITHQMTQTRTT